MEYWEKHLIQWVIREYPDDREESFQVYFKIRKFIMEHPGSKGYFDMSWPEVLDIIIRNEREGVS